MRVSPTAGAVNGGVAADFYPIFENGDAGLLHLLPAGLSGDKAKPFGANGGTAMDDATGTDL